MKEFKYSAKDKQKALTMWVTEGKPMILVCKRMNCSERSLYRWRKIWDGTEASLTPLSSRPHTQDRKAHTDEERKLIAQVLNDNPKIGLTEIYAILRAKYGYTRHYISRSIINTP